MMFTFNVHTVEKQRILELLLKRDKNCQQHQWLSHRRKWLANNVIDYIADNGNIKELPHQKVKQKRLLANNAIDYIADNGNIKELPHQKVQQKRLFSKAFNNVVNNSGVYTIFEKGDKSTMCDQDIISGNIKTINFSYTIRIFTMEKKTKLKSKSKIKGSTKLDFESNTKSENETSIKTSFNLGSEPNTKVGSKTNTKLGNETSTKTSFNLGSKSNTELGNETSTKTSFNLGSKPNTKLGSKTSTKTDFTPIVIQPIFLAADSSAFESLFHNVGEEIVLVDSSVIDQDQGRQEWYNQLDHFVFLEELVTNLSLITLL